MASAAHCTVVDALAVSVGWLGADSVAVFGYWPQLDAAVGLVTCTLADAPDAMLPKLHESVLAPIEHAPLAGLIDQLIPEPVGSGSDNVTALAVPVPVFIAVIVNPMGSPALTVAASAVFVSASAGQFTVMVADACTDPVLVAAAVAVFG
jgi:hypothetical protein